MARRTRRELLQTGAVVAGGLAAARLLAACGGSDATITSMPDLTDLAGALRGKVILPDSPRYHASRVVWNSRFDGARPVAIVQAADSGDVRTAVDFARDHGLRPIARSGAHSFAGYSTGDGLVIDVTRLSRVEADAKAERATLGAGATVLPTYRALWPHRRAISGGTCPTVGVTGLTAGGGLGFLSRRYGATCDRLVEVEMVTADGKLVRANERENEDLYWATRGGGGGNFGVITSLAFELVPVDTPFTHADYVFPWKAAERLLAAWQDWLPTAPHESSCLLEVLNQAPDDADTPMVELEVVNAGSEAATRRVMADLLGAVGVPPVQANFTTGPFFDEVKELYCKGLRPKECELAGKSPSGEFPRAALFAKSNLARGPWPREGLKVLLDGMERRQRDRTLTPRDFSPAHTTGKLIIEPADGAVNAIAPGATAFVHRDSLFDIQYQARWRRGASKHIADANIGWTNDLYERTKPYRSGFAYQDYIDPELADWQHAYYGANLERLRRVKAKYDPDDLFRFAQSIPPAGGSHA
jgi:FAD/FMN-containing dehydrogenase